ncbi:Exodeoxyribonuclease 7 small subunit [Prochlorococcus marinus str. MIT 1342]|uniref:exodeoxyribonuclease VII small subunit n=1 Tax=Prochlorococcus TaxID=1218 RepID=UPI0007B35D24|nr:exodeoxyribonuclease VII small subunit [Prochlorococcus marinus]KZR83145.1 Exodeoxyribonuclease 7 small subunit [Prochlorococcus marinus str. MIT 1342]
MIKATSSSEKTPKDSGSKQQKHAINTAQSTLDSMLKEWRQDAKSLSYEESLQALDLLLTQLQNDSVPVEELQRHYLQGKVYLEHCEALLNTVEQSVLQLDASSLKADSDT